MELLGVGSYGHVFKALEKSTGKIVAIKLIELKKYDQIEECIKEMEILASCKSKYIVSYYTTYCYEEYLWIILEFCGGGSVKDIIKV